MDGGPPVFPPGFTCPAVLWILAADRLFRLRDFHPLSLAFPCHSTRWIGRDASPNPNNLKLLVWPPPRSLATTCGISVDVFSSSYLDVSVQTVPHVRLFYSTHVDGVWLHRVSPFGYLRINAYLPLPEAFRSLSRPSSAPDAKAFTLRSFKLDLVKLLVLSRIMQALSTEVLFEIVFVTLFLIVPQIFFFAYFATFVTPLCCLAFHLLCILHCSVFKVQLKVRLYPLN